MRKELSFSKTSLTTMWPSSGIMTHSQESLSSQNDTPDYITRLLAIYRVGEQCPNAGILQHLSSSYFAIILSCLRGRPTHVGKT